MLSRRTLWMGVIAVGALSAPIFLGLLVKDSVLFADTSTQNSLAEISGDTASSTPETMYGLPVHIKIPQINVDASVEDVGLTSAGAVDTPKDRKDVAWFTASQHPGENGTAVIDGHYGGQGSVFNDLYKLHTGDKIYVQDDKGVTTTFIVRENRRYDPQADAYGVFSSNDGNSHLNLITCEGLWDETSKSYSERLVVFADREI